MLRPVHRAWLIACLIASVLFGALAPALAGLARPARQLAIPLCAGPAKGVVRIDLGQPVPIKAHAADCDYCLVSAAPLDLASQPPFVPPQIGHAPQVAARDVGPPSPLIARAPPARGPPSLV
jgi:hypothetical protein